MKKTHLFAAAVAALVVVTGLTLAGGGQVKSGPQINEKVPGPFHPLNLTGKMEGKKHCLYCENGPNPVAMVFARDSSPQLTKLIKKIDDVTTKNASCSMGSFVVFLSDSEKLPTELKTMATNEKINTTVLAIDNPAGPEGYNVAKDANITVVLYVKTTVAANYSFRSASDLTDKMIDQIINDVSKIQPK
jgi:hypothetical protein